MHQHHYVSIATYILLITLIIIYLYIYIYIYIYIYYCEDKVIIDADTFENLQRAIQRRFKIH